jgi:hypothetical protein
MMQMAHDKWTTALETTNAQFSCTEQLYLIGSNTMLSINRTGI